MIIWGTRGLVSTVEEGTFHCPSCNLQRAFRLRQSRNWFTLYFIPVIPLNVAGRFVECASCGGSYAEEIRSYDPVRERKKTEEQMLRVMVLSALADGQVDQGERNSIEQQYLDFAGLPVLDSVLDQEIAMAQQSGTTLNQYLGSQANQLTPHGKALIVKLAFETMSSSGGLEEGHQKELSQLAKTLGIPEEQYRALIAHISEADS
ncbi:MAG: zinc-ribbon domain-containing protein [Pirellulaceae bacterium]|nr:zinc-ribbon domain-containing protein [Pirellulaceae bacterium]